MSFFRRRPDQADAVEASPEDTSSVALTTRVVESPALPVPAGRYRLIAEIGRGSAGVVYRGQDVHLGRPIAIKVFHMSSLSPEQAAHQTAELTTLASLNHPGIVTLFDSGTDLSDPERPRGYLVMELVMGVDLQRMMASGPMTIEQIAELAVDLLSALRYMHASGVIHRDIKPSNILLVDDQDRPARMRAKLSDFGTALSSSSQLNADQSQGTPAYQSPEQLMGESASMASDVYSLGLVLLQCFAGTGIDPRWSAVLDSMTAPRPQDRPTVDQLAELLVDQAFVQPAGSGRHRAEEPTA